MGGFSKAEREAMKERAAELQAEASSGKKGSKKAKEEKACLDAIAEMKDGDREIAERVHAIVTKEAPQLAPKTWYGMPAYADYKGKVVVFLQMSAKFETRYCTLGFNDVAQLDDGDMWPSAYAVTKVSAAVEKEIARLVKRAVG
ncbi:iron chaperone [Actinomycetota bacterium]